MAGLNNINSLIPTNGINAANYLKVPINPQPIGSLNSEQIQGLIAQAQASTAQPANVISDKGIGAYGIQPQQLEKAGYLKPGTTATYLRPGANVSQVLSSPAVWTGKDGVVGKNELLNNKDLQASITQNIMSVDFGSLQKLGVVTGKESADQLGALLQTSNKFGPSVTQAWSKGTAPAQLTPDINNTARAGQYAVNFVNTKLPSFSTGITGILGAFGTVDRTSLDSAVKSVLGSDRLPIPNYKQTEAPLSTPVRSPVSQKELERSQLQIIETRQNYENVLRAYRGDRTNPAVVAAFDKYKAAIAEADRLSKLLGL
jgi:hypothetical protein